VIAFLDGEVAERRAGVVVLGVGGVGYEVHVPSSTFAKVPPVGRSTRLHTRTVVRDDGTTLYGFASTEERDIFDLLITVTGVGPKMALGFLSALSPDAFRRAVASGDVDALTVVPGVGKKVAQRVALDLKDRLGGDVVVVEGPLADVREALLSLGLTPQEAGEAMAGIHTDGDRSIEDLLREALQHAGRG
jgi:Holliday junction DNA helicase RuvA